MKNKKLIVINFLGGPGSGKSTLASLLFSKLKMAGVSCEIAMEFAKEIVWENRIGALNNQLYILGEQFYRIWRVKDSVDVIITDSPILLSILYNELRDPSIQIPPEHFTPLIIDCHNMFNNINYFVKRSDFYETAGRIQTNEDSFIIEQKLVEVLNKHNIPYTSVKSDEETANMIFKEVLQKIKA